MLQDNIGYGRFGGHPVRSAHRVVVVIVGGVGPAQDQVRPLHVRDRLERGVGPPGRGRGGPQLIKVYALSGLLAGFAGVLSLAQFGTTAIAGQSQTNLNVIAAVVIGGTSIFGGVGTMFGTVVGLFIPAVLQYGFVIIGVRPSGRQVAVGAVLIAAVYVDQQRRAAASRGKGV